VAKSAGRLESVENSIVRHIYYTKSAPIIIITIIGRILLRHLHIIIYLNHNQSTYFILFFFVLSLPGPHRRHGKNEKNFAYAYRPSITVHGVYTAVYTHYVTLYYYNTTYTGRTTMLFIQRFGRFRKIIDKTRPV